MAPAITQEHYSVILKKMEDNDRGLSSEDIKSLFPNFQVTDVVKMINKLISKRMIWLYTQGEEVLYKREADKPESLKDAEKEELVVYQIIKECGNKGIWIRDIRTKSNLTPMILNKTLKLLENKKCIKSVKTVTAGKKKVYMLYDLEPDSSLTGGSWYSDQDYETEFIDILNAQCYNYLLMKKEKSFDVPGGPLAQNNLCYASVREVSKYINDLRISNINLSETDIISLLNTLVYDDKVMRKQSGDGTLLYKAADSLLSPTGPSCMPCCTFCTVYKSCRPVGQICPTSCKTITDWLNLD